MPFQFQAQALRQRSRDQFRVVPAALTPAVPVQRDGRDQVGAPLVRNAQHDFGEPRREPIAQARHLIVFQQQHGLDEPVVA
jgi:hypothetical protein